ncbi:hypothetical protein EUGRSUZ_D02662 [Eucalyptus grandis]|uniref:Uncharacterized protein n=2 Tax=Eucalyptus grandis TaxID=71139 RepID=A0A059CK56_EUCGR|nr:hypothetical protein EUGRSUZ_D02662 [Eucalyptus grandis]
MRKFDLLQSLLVTMVLTLSLRRNFSVYLFRVNSLGEVGMKRVSKVVCDAGKELLLVVLNHLQVRIIVFAFGLFPK